MNDPGLDEPIEESFNQITHTLRDQISESSQQSPGPQAQFRHELEVDKEEEEIGFAESK